MVCTNGKPCKIAVVAELPQRSAKTPLRYRKGWVKAAWVAGPWAAACCVCHLRVKARRSCPSALALDEVTPTTVVLRKKKDMKVTIVII